MYNEIEHYLVTIITESYLEDKLAKDFDRLGANGYTISDVRGKGDHGVRKSNRKSDKNIKIEAVCCIDVSTAIIEYAHKTYFADYAMIAFKNKVEVARRDKF